MSWFEKLKRFFAKKPSEKDPFWNFDRGSPRCHIQLFVRLQGKTEFAECPGDVNLGGFFFVSQEAFAPQALIDVHFMLPNEGVSIPGSGLVHECQSAPDGHHVRGRFVNMNLEDKRLLARWLYESTIKNEDR